MTDKKQITVKVLVDAPVEVVWEKWTTPSDIVHWNQASDDWHTPRAENDLRPGGRFVYRMEARDGSAGFDFSGCYDTIIPHEHIAYTIDDGRKVNITFATQDGQTNVTETFAAEEYHPVEMQRAGWQAILDQFKIYVESEQKQAGGRL